MNFTPALYSDPGFSISLALATVAVLGQPPGITGQSQASLDTGRISYPDG